MARQLLSCIRNQKAAAKFPDSRLGAVFFELLSAIGEPEFKIFRRRDKKAAAEDRGG